jgi:hypothetical protein
MQLEAIDTQAWKWDDAVLYRATFRRGVDERITTVRMPWSPDVAERKQETWIAQVYFEAVFWRQGWTREPGIEVRVEALRRDGSWVVVNVERIGQEEFDEEEL